MCQASRETQHFYSLLFFLFFRLSEAASRPRAERSFISRPISQFSGGSSNNSLNMPDAAPAAAPMPVTRDVGPPVVAAPPAPAKVPTARGLYDFDPGKKY